VDILDVPEMNFIMIDGAGDPNTSQEFQEAVEALFSISYTWSNYIWRSEADYFNNIILDFYCDRCRKRCNMKEFSTQNHDRAILYLQTF
jgi:hypothetical protein